MKTTQCEYCHVAMEKRRATKERPYLYRLSGLKNFYLTGIEVFVCPQCQHEIPIIPRMAQLQASIADEIIRKPEMLAGDEIRFLRKHAGFPARSFATLIGISPEHLSRIENGHTEKLGKPTDRLVRALTLRAKEGKEARDTLLSVANGLAKRKKRKGAEQVYTVSRQGWRRSA